MVEAMDHEIGRILDELDTHSTMAANTTVVFIGDNGTPDKPAKDVGTEDVVKGTLFEGGIHVPFIVKSPLIDPGTRGGRTKAMVSAVDLYATMAELAGAPLSESELAAQGLDSRSFVPTLMNSSDASRTHVVTELYRAPGVPFDDPNRHTFGRTIHSGAWKLHIDVSVPTTPTGPRLPTPPRVMQRTETLYHLPDFRPEGAPTCSGNGRDTEHKCHEDSRAVKAYQEMAAIEQSIRTSVDPRLGHCGDEAMECPITLPIRVMPRDPADFTRSRYTVKRRVRLSAAALSRTTGGHLYLQGHRLGYRDGHEVGGRPVKDGKAAVAVGSCDFKVLRNADPDIEIHAPERHYGGIGGGFRTVRVSIPLDAFGRRCLSEGTNEIRFRFEGTDGVTSGYRIVDLNLRDASGTDILPDSAFIHEDPETWAAPSYAAADVDEGARLFAARNILAESPLRADRLVASCADCHAHDGRDLEYFAYSNESIINRAVFHGLTEQQGEQIAAWVRLHPAKRHGRPWNPPYQPGAGVESAELWAAGAGVSAVLDDEVSGARAMLDAIFPRGWKNPEVIASQLRGVGLEASTSNLRKMPIAIQLVDWNGWLPETHPLDLWGPAYLDATHGQPYTPCPGATTPERVYLGMRKTLGGSFDAADIPAAVGGLELAARDWVACQTTLNMGTEWRTLRSSTLDEAIGRGYATDYTKRNLAQWLAVKNWEAAQEFGLEILGPKVYGKYGERLSWPFGNHQSVHAIAPHIVSSDRDHLQTPLEAEMRWQRSEVKSATAGPAVTLYRDRWCFRNETQAKTCLDRASGISLTPACPEAVVECFENFDYPKVHAVQSSLKGDYDSTAWYHLQLLLHAGAHNPRGMGNEAVRPVDWPYGYIHIDDLARTVSDGGTGPQVWESLRYVATLTKAYQMRDNGRGPGRVGWSMRDISPRLLVGSYRGFARQDELWVRLNTYGGPEPGSEFVNLRQRLGNAFLMAFLDVVDPQPGDPHYTADLAQDFSSAGWDRRGPTDSGTALWWKLEPATTAVAPFHALEAALRDPRRPLCIGPGCGQPIDGLGTGDPSGGARENEFQTSIFFPHAQHIYRLLPWLTNVGLDPCLLRQLATWGETMWPGPGRSNDWHSAHGNQQCPRE